jgi:CheY-like chemotaxis protein
MPTILFADDNRNVREFLRRELEDEGYHVVLARDGAEAIRLTRRAGPDVVILDICMPAMDGLEAAGQIGTFWPDVPIIFFTSFDDDCTRDERSCWATACVEKREDLTELKRVVAAALASHRHNRPYRLGLPPAALSASPATQQAWLRAKN